MQRTHRSIIAVAVLLGALGGSLVFFCSQTAPDDRRNRGQVAPGATPAGGKGGIVGSSRCRPCHEHFYKLWAPSHHGTAMQPYSSDFAKRWLPAQEEPVVIGGSRWQVDIERGCMWEEGPGGKKAYPMRHVMGGKNVFFFLTPLERGRLQVMPLAFNVRQKRWYITTESMVRHALDIPDEALDWRQWPLTFNTACHGCHVSQLEVNYDLATDTYHTTWAEPGINCETCHGPAAEHVKICQEAAQRGEVPAQLRIIQTSTFTIEQINSLCASCHAKLRPITKGFQPGERFFDHYGLATLEDQDFYPDGRDLGENYTYTAFLMSPCAKSGKLSCMHCHTSSGRYRFTGKKENQSCMPCHEEKVSDPPAHTRHSAESEGSLCRSCHMPMTQFAMMRRSDHSMLPPTPAATKAFRSPNACNLCHKDKDAAWADKWVRSWHSEEYQKPVLRRARLIVAARRGRWSELPKILAYLERKDHDAVFAASLLRLLGRCEDTRKWPSIRKAASDPSPLVRAAAAYALGFEPLPENRRVLVSLARDQYRIVRVEVGAALTLFPWENLPEEERAIVQGAVGEYLDSLKSRPDDGASHYNLGNYHFNRGELKKAVAQYEVALKLRPEMVPAMVNAALAWARLGNTEKSQSYLQRAVSTEPGNAVANFNLGLLLAEKGDPAGAEEHLRRALKADPRFPEAAYNLGVLIAGCNLSEAIDWCRKAASLRPEEPKYAYTLAYYLSEAGYREEALLILEGLVEKHPGYADSYALLGALYEKEQRLAEAASIYRRAVESADLPEFERARFSQLLKALQAGNR